VNDSAYATEGEEEKVDHWPLVEGYAGILAQRRSKCEWVRVELKRTEPGTLIISAGAAEGFEVLMRIPVGQDKEIAAALFNAVLAELQEGKLPFYQQKAINSRVAIVVPMLASKGGREPKCVIEAVARAKLVHNKLPVFIEVIDITAHKETSDANGSDDWKEYSLANGSSFTYLMPVHDYEEFRDEILLWNQELLEHLKKKQTGGSQTIYTKASPSPGVH